LLAFLASFNFNAHKISGPIIRQALSGPTGGDRFMKEFSSYISETWNIREPVAKEIAESFEKGASPLFCADYRPSICAEVTISELWSISDFLKAASALSPQKKRLINALKKAGKLTDQVERRITLSFNPFELDDMLLPERPNPRSKAQIALKKGLGAMADRIQRQENDEGPIADFAAPYIGSDPTLTSADDVIAGVKDILAERFAYDETARGMVREFAYDDGYFEVQLKNKKDPEFSRFSGKPIALKEMPKEDLLILLCAEDKKAVRLKLGVRLFRISELLKHHFVSNPECSGYDLICQAIDDCWIRLLQPIIERDVKERLRKEAEQWALEGISKALAEKLGERRNDGVFLTFGMFDAKHLALVAFNAQGHLLGASLDKKFAGDKPIVSERLRQFSSRYKPALIIIPEHGQADQIEEIVHKSIDAQAGGAEIVRAPITASATDLSHSQWMKRNFSDLDESMRKAFAVGLVYIQPISLIAKIGIAYFSIHPLQSFVPADRCIEMIERVLSETLLHEGIPVNEADSAALHLLPTLPDAMAREMRAAGTKINFTTKNDLLKLPGMTEAIFRNIAGYVVIPYSENPLDRTTVHPDHFQWVADMCNELSLSLDAVVNNPESLRSIAETDMAGKIFIEKKLIGQLEIGQQYITPLYSKHRRKLLLEEFQEGTIVAGHVTNITPFGVFVNIHAVCEGLIHISQLADTYIETPEQVVTLGQPVNVRIIRIDPKKRRISLSMKGLSTQPAKISPSKRQLTSLASHFQNR
jgi:protein Tex